MNLRYSYYAMASRNIQNDLSYLISHVINCWYCYYETMFKPTIFGGLGSRKKMILYISYKTFKIWQTWFDNLNIEKYGMIIYISSNIA